MGLQGVCSLISPGVKILKSGLVGWGGSGVGGLVRVAAGSEVGM